MAAKKPTVAVKQVDFDVFKPRVLKTRGTIEMPVVTMGGFSVPVGFGLDSGDADIDEEVLQDIVEEKLASVATDLAMQLENALRGALKSAVWSWPGGMRDIFDTGKLASSGKVLVGADGLTVVYTAPYSEIVHNGGYIHPYGNKQARPIYLPGRPWIRSVLYGEGPVPQFDFEGFFESKFG